ncbi:LADA_0G07624g1_1 [Lachancea dasiensis]|uniref:non-specific serine/threonine protein kinase n=1 Tax=Lachancea dasiensis TaxID=1072105 RepID=A0A1G4JTN8_9SACH|nr:LADA_0G07624g1_1 [Lachancea dasiensis]
MNGKRTPADYVFLEKLGQGSYSTVFRAVERNKSSRNYAIKVCSKKHIIREKKVKYVTIEKDLLNNLAQGAHPGIVRLFCTFHDAESLYYVLEYVSGGELLGLLRRNGPLPEAWSKHLFAQLVDTVDYMHSQGVIHRDLKPENILLSQEGRVVITDFGAACVLSNLGQSKDEDRAASFVGTAEYVAPELLMYSQCGLGSDIWALGCILYQLTQGAPPFRGENELQTFEQIVALNYKWRLPTTPQISTLVRRILVLDPLQRPTSKQLKQEAWLSSIEWNDKAFLWKGIWQLPNKSKAIGAVYSAQGRSQASNGPNIIDSPAGTIKVNRKKPASTKSTSAIVEWRKNLGLGSLPTPPPSAGSTKPPLNTHMHSQQQQQHTGPMASANIAQTPPPSAAPPKISASSTPFLKRSLINIFEIPYRASQESISLGAFSNVQDTTIANFVAKNNTAILERSSNCILSLDVKGRLACQRPNQPVTYMVSVSDPDLSMYDFEFNELSRTGFLILEKYKSRLWFLSSVEQKDGLQPNAHPMNEEKPWIDCFFTARKMVSEADNSVAKSRSSPNPNEHSRSNNSAKIRPKSRGEIPSRMVVSSSRYEVLRALSDTSIKTGDASRGASAAFNSLRKS